MKKIRGLAVVQTMIQKKKAIKNKKKSIKWYKVEAMKGSEQQTHLFDNLYASTVI